MRITKHSDYSLRVLMYLAAHPERSCTIKEISESYDISQNHLMKVVQQLAQLGFAKTVRGKNGGIWLGEPAENIFVGDVLNQLGEGSELVECISEEANCKITSLCELKHVFAKAQRAFFQTLNEYSLADILGDRAAVATLLQLSPKALKAET